MANDGGGGASTTFSWENCKENAAPLPRGRTVTHLEQPEMSSRDKAAQVQAFEQRIMDEAESDAPLAPWIDYIKWHENHFPSQVHAQFVLLERCCLAFQNDPRFCHDHRYIRLCCLYADKTREPTTTFQELYRAGIGRESAVFWNAWAYVAEKSNNFRLADRIFRHAVDTERAEPLPYLLQRKKHFEKRMAKHFLESLDDAGISGEEEDEEQQNQRSIFGSVAGGVGTSRAVRHGPSSSSSTTTFIDRSMQGTTSRPGARQGARENNPPTNNHTQPSFAIYGEDKSLDDHSLFDDSRIVHSEREPEVQRWKENRGPRERWNERIHGPSIPIAQTSAFSVYVDEQCAAENARKEQERLRKEELHRQNRRGIVTTGTTGGDGQDKKRSKPAWKKNLLKDSFGKEQCFEEARMEAGWYRLVGAAANLNLIAPETSKVDNDDSSMSMCGSNDDSVMYDETAVLDKRLLHMLQPKEAAVPTDSDHYDARMVIQNPPPQPVTIPMNTSWNSNVSGRLPTPTANMQFAMNQVSMMFSSPMVGDGIMGEHAPALLIHQDSPIVGRENDLHRRYPDARSLPEAEAHVLNNLRQEDEADRSVLGCRRAATDRRRIGTIRQDNPMAGLQEHDLPTNPGFSVYEDNNGESYNTTANTTIGAANNHAPTNHPGLSVYQDVARSSELFRTGAASHGFTVFQDEPTSHNNNALSSIFRRTTAVDQEAVDDDSVSSEDLRMFGGAAAAGEATITSNAFDRLTLGARSTTARAPLPPFGDLSTIEHEDQTTSEIPTTTTARGRPRR